MQNIVKAENYEYISFKDRSTSKKIKSPIPGLDQ